MSASYLHLRSYPILLPIGTNAIMHGKSGNDNFNDHVVGWEVGGAPATLLYPNRANYREGVDIFPIYAAADPAVNVAYARTLTRVFEFTTFDSNRAAVFDVTVTVNAASAAAVPGTISCDLRPLLNNPALFVNTDTNMAVGYLVDRTDIAFGTDYAFRTGAEIVTQNAVAGVVNMSTTDGLWAGSKDTWTWRFWIHAINIGTGTTTLISPEVQPQGGYALALGVL